MLHAGGLHLEENRHPEYPSLIGRVSNWRPFPTGLVLGDWIGKQVLPGWNVPWGPMPFIQGLPSRASFARKKALTAAAANYGTPMLWAEGLSADPPLARDEDGEWIAPKAGWQGELVFTAADLQATL